MEWLKVSEFTTVITGGTPSTSKKQYWNNGTIPWLNSGELNKNRIYDSKKFITKEGLDNSSAKMMPPDTVLIALTGTTTGVSSILKLTACANQSVTGILPSKKHIPEYLFYYLLFTRKQILKDAYGGAQKHISQAYVKDIKIPLPPLSVQKEIAEKLDKADALRKKDQELLKQYDELAQAIFIDMFGDPVQNEKGWEIANIEQLVTKEKNSIKRGPFGGALKKEIFIEKGYLVYEQYHALNNDFTFERYFIDEVKFEELKGFEVKPNDIIISCSGVYLGKLAIVPTGAKKGIINQALLKLTLDETKITNDFFSFHFTQPTFRRTYFDANRGAGIPNFPPMSDFKKFPFIKPPISLQNQFADKIQNLEAQKEILKKQAQLSEELFQALLQESFSF